MKTQAFWFLAQRSFHNCASLETSASALMHYWTNQMWISSLFNFRRRVKICPLSYQLLSLGFYTRVLEYLLIRSNKASRYYEKSLVTRVSFPERIMNWIFPGSSNFNIFFSCSHKFTGTNQIMGANFFSQKYSI